MYLLHSLLCSTNTCHNKPQLSQQKLRSPNPKLQSLKVKWKSSRILNWLRKRNRMLHRKSQNKSQRKNQSKKTKSKKNLSKKEESQNKQLPSLNYPRQMRFGMFTETVICVSVKQLNARHILKVKNFTWKRLMLVKLVNLDLQDLVFNSSYHFPR